MRIHLGLNTDDPVYFLRANEEQKFHEFMPLIVKKQPAQENASDTRGKLQSCGITLRLEIFQDIESADLKR